MMSTGNPAHHLHLDSQLHGCSDDLPEYNDRLDNGTHRLDTLLER